MNKVKYNLKNVHVAPIEDSGYGEVFAIPGAVSLTLDARGDINTFYADGIAYYQSAPNNGYEGSVEMALITDEFKTVILGDTVSTNGILVENVNAKPKNFAFGFQIDGDAKDRFYWFYNCSATRPSVSSSTNTESKEPQTETMSISCVPDADGNVKGASTDTYSGTASQWFSTVTKPTA